MTLILDQCVYEPIIRALEAVQYDCVRLSLVTGSGQSPNEAVMQASLDRQAVLVPLDTGIPSQAYVDEFAAKGLTVVLLRWKTATPKDWQQILETILRHGAEWERIAASNPSVVSVRYRQMRPRPWSSIPRLVVVMYW